MSDRQPLLPIAAALTLLILVVGAVLAIVLLVGGEAHSGSLPAVTAAGASNLPTVSSRPAVPNPGSTGPPPASPSGAANEGTTLFSTVAYRGVHFTAQVPSGWSPEENEAPKEGYTESKWRNPAHSSDSLLVDFSPAPHLPLAKDAAPVHEALLRASGYSELAYGPGDLAGTPAWVWVFRIPGYQRVDYFFEKCTTGFAVLGSTTPARFAQLQAMFHAVAQSVQSTCNGG